MKKKKTFVYLAATRHSFKISPFDLNAMSMIELICAREIISAFTRNIMTNWVIRVLCDLELVSN